MRNPLQLVHTELVPDAGTPAPCTRCELAPSLEVLCYRQSDGTWRWTCQSCGAVNLLRRRDGRSSADGDQVVTD